jgi:hypothetical protein
MSSEGPVGRTSHVSKPNLTWRQATSLLLQAAGLQVSSSSSRTSSDGRLLAIMWLVAISR